MSPAMLFISYVMREHMILLNISLYNTKKEYTCNYRWCFVFFEDSFEPFSPTNFCISFCKRNDNTSESLPLASNDILFNVSITGQTLRITDIYYTKVCFLKKQTT
ncbi:hypothetical protein SEVIR_5G323600v4 [Setaria viridis]|uniref:Uncharacterized protein n=1 Tax=Setaria viridis TaxID=4556 RepID=A0A4U6UKN0_SETVI|nr:hypothetical protein SEVIR_5G323600v2 [Setaria viridis]